MDSNSVNVIVVFSFPFSIDQAFGKKFFLWVFFFPLKSHDTELWSSVYVCVFQGFGASSKERG